MKYLLTVSSLVCFLSLVARGDIRCTIVDDTFARHDVSLKSIEGDTLTFSEGEAKQTMPMSRLAWIDREPGAAEPSTPAADAKARAYVIQLRDGQRWPGAPGDIADDALSWASPVIGIRAVALKDIAQIDLAPAKATPASTPPTQDELRLTNGDVVSGVISGGDAKELICQNADGQAIHVEWANIRQVRLAAAGAPTKSTATTRIELHDGTVMLADGVALKNDLLEIKAGKAHASVKASELVALEPLAGGVRLLNRIAPQRAEYVPYFPPVSTASTGTTDVPSTLTVGDVRTRAFLAARPKSTMTWSLDGTATRFRTRYAIADGHPIADVTVRVRLDDKVAFEQTHVRSGSVSQPIDVPLGGAKSLTLEVDYGETYDVQDELYWIEPALLAK